MPGGSLWVAVPEKYPSEGRAIPVLMELIKLCRKARGITTDITDEELARRLGLTVRTLQRRIQILEDEKFIVRKRRNGRRTITLNFRLAAKEQPSAKPSATHASPVAARINTREEREANAEPVVRTVDRPTVSAGEPKAAAAAPAGWTHGNPPTSPEERQASREEVPPTPEQVPLAVAQARQPGRAGIMMRQYLCRLVTSGQISPDLVPADILAPPRIAVNRPRTLRPPPR